MSAMINLLLLFAVCLSTYFSSSAVVASDVTTSSPVSEADNPTLTIEHVSSTINSIKVRWNSTTAPDNGTRSGSEVRIEAFNLATQMTVVSPNVQSTAQDFTIPDLAVDAEYRVCVVRIDDNEKACDFFRTIPLVRLDTILAVLVTLAFIALLVLTAIICWRCALHQATAHEEEPEQSGRDGNGKVCNASPTTEDQLLSDEKEPLLIPANRTAAPAPNNEPQSPTSLYLFLAGPALETK